MTNINEFNITDEELREIEQITELAQDCTNNLIDCLVDPDTEEKVELDEEDKKFVKEKVGNHYRLTKSARGKMINDDFNNNVAKFKKVIPKDYKEVMEFVREKEVEGLNREEALAFAFNAKVGIN